MRFNDNIRRIDLILVYKVSADNAASAAEDGAAGEETDADDNQKKDEEEKRRKRESFLAALTKKGLEWEVEEPEMKAKKEEREGGEEGEEESEGDLTDGLAFIKVHAPWEVLR